VGSMLAANLSAWNWLDMPCCLNILGIVNI